MKNNLRNNYFVIIKLCGLLLMLGLSLIRSNENVILASRHIFVGALFIFASIIYEIYEDKHKISSRCLIAGEGILSIVAIFLFPVDAIFMMSVTILDVVGLKWKKSPAYLCAYIPVVLCIKTDGIDIFVIIGIVTALIIFYIQDKLIIAGYKENMVMNIESESRLKSDMELSNNRHKTEMNKSSLHYENMMLEEKGRLSQALHDKLGHSINGSLYKLEAAKVLIDKKPEESKTILQEVIDNLRGSMDEIRGILRRERPDKKRMAMLSLQSLCEECEEQYGINAVLNIDALDEKVPENVWEVILDNTFEAVTNALKYANCKNIYIDIIVLNAVVRCTIKDDGKGASSFEEGMGLQGMKARVRKLKGFIDVESEGGFTINMILPYEAK